MSTFFRSLFLYFLQKHYLNFLFSLYLSDLHNLFSITSTRLNNTLYTKYHIMYSIFYKFLNCVTEPFFYYRCHRLLEQYFHYLIKLIFFGVFQNRNLSHLLVEQTLFELDHFPPYLALLLLLQWSHLSLLLLH